MKDFIFNYVVVDILQGVSGAFLISNHRKQWIVIMVKMLPQESFILITIYEPMTVIILRFTNETTKAQRDKVTSPES